MPLQNFAAAERTLPAMLSHQAETHGERILVRFGEIAWTYAQTIAVARSAAASLAAAGIEAGDRVALMLGNRPEFMQLFLGCAWLGAVAVPLNTAYRSTQLAHVLQTSGARLLIIDAASIGEINTLDPGDLALESVWTVDGPCQQNPHWPQQTLPAPCGSIDAGTVAASDTVAILYTSGTTGLSKGVCSSHAQYYWWGVNSAEILGVRDGDVLMTSLPLFHTNALNSFYQAMLTGTTLVVEPRFSASGFFASLARHKATVTYLLGAMVPILLSRDRGVESRTHRTRVALAPGVPPRFQKQFTESFGIGLVDGYGSTETNFVIGSPLEDGRAGTMGRLRKGFQARIADAEDNELPDGAAGELLLRAEEPFAFASGYFGMPEKTVESWRNLWFHTGDRVVRESDGYFRFIDRMKDAIRRRGENISSFEVEQVLIRHPEIENAAVFPVPSTMAEDEVMAAVVLRNGAQLTFFALLDYCQKEMPRFAVPRYIEFVDKLPMTENGKVTKHILRERGITDRTWDREAVGYRLGRQ